jgi:hypothetical protein
MSPFMGKPIGFDAATLALLDAALTDLYADFRRGTVKLPTTAPLVSEIDVSGTERPIPVTAIGVQKRSPKKAASSLRFNKGRGWHLS